MRPRFLATTLAAGLLCLVAGCSSGNGGAAGGVTQREADALNDAAAMLDDNGADAVIDTNAADSAGNVE